MVIASIWLVHALFKDIGKLDYLVVIGLKAVVGRRTASVWPHVRQVPFLTWAVRVNGGHVLQRRVLLLLLLLG